MIIIKKYECGKEQGGVRARMCVRNTAMGRRARTILLTGGMTNGIGKYSSLNRWFCYKIFIQPTYKTSGIKIVKHSPARARQITVLITHNTLNIYLWYMTHTIHANYYNYKTSKHTINISKKWHHANTVFSWLIEKGVINFRELQNC